MKRLRAAVFMGFALLAGVPRLAHADVGAERGTRDAATTNLATLMRAAERHYPSLRASEHAIVAAQARLDEARISPFFQITATAAVGLAPEARGTPIFSPDSQLPLSNDWQPVVRAGVEGAIPLYTFGKLSAARDAASAGVRAARHDRARSLAQVRFDVRRAYYALQLSLDAQAMIDEGRGHLERAVRKLEERIESGDPDVNEMDRWRLAATLAEVSARGSEARRLEDSSRAALRVLTGLRAIRVPDCPSHPVEFRSQPVERYVGRAIRARPETHMLKAAIDARQADLTATRARYLPDLALAFGAWTSYGPGITDQDNPFVLDPANYDAITAALVARWSLDIWGNVYRVRRAEESLLETRMRAQEAQGGMALEVATASYEVEDARRRVEAWGRGHRDARSWFVASVQAYQVGALEPRDLVDAVRAYFTARFSHAQAIHDFNAAVAKLERATGTGILPASQWERCDP